MKTYNLLKPVTRRGGGGAASVFFCLMLLMSLPLLGCSSDHDDPPVDKPERKLPPLNVSDSLALVSIYKQCGPWGINWDLEKIETWAGVSVAYETESKQLRVVGYEIYNGGFYGSFPKEFCQLTELRRLAVSGGRMTGVIPEEIGNLTNLTYLCIQCNEMGGVIPESIGKLVYLKELALGFNKLGGTIPESIGNLENLEYLKIIESNVSGSVPKTLGNLMNLKIAWLLDNKLSGTFPIEAIRHNCVINCRGNNIEALPFEYWKDDNPYYPPELLLNRLSGEIPDWVFKTKKWHLYAPTCVDTQQENYGYSNFYFKTPKI